MNFGAALKAARVEAGLVQAELARRADLDLSYVSLLENNRKSPTLTVYFRLCKVLNVTPSDMMKRVEEAGPAAPKRPRPRKPDRRS